MKVELKLFTFCAQSNVNRFQVVLIESTAGDTYAVFIYDCGTMMWGGGVIGWQASSSDYMASDRSGQTDNNDIACSYSRRQSAIVYRLCELGTYSYSPMWGVQCLFLSLFGSRARHRFRNLM